MTREIEPLVNALIQAVKMERDLFNETSDDYSTEALMLAKERTALCKKALLEARTPPEATGTRFERGCFVIMELMQAYERRVRSDCTPEQIEKRPWECAEYLKAAEYLRNVWPPHEPPQPAEATECRYCDEVMKERDDYHEWADTLAYDIERLVGVEIGEHSNLNSPWGNAHDAAEYELDKRARKPHEPQGWQPIETAPADTDVLLYCPDRHYTNPERVELGQAKNTKGGSAHSWATHWMPLPSAPSTKAGS